MSEVFTRTYCRGDRYVDGVRYVRFDDGGQDSESWEGFFGPRMTDVSVRLNTEDAVGTAEIYDLGVLVIFRNFNDSISNALSKRSNNLLNLAVSLYLL